MKKPFYLTQLLINTPYLIGHFYYNNFFQLQVFLANVNGFSESYRTASENSIPGKRKLKRDLTMALIYIYLYLQYGMGGSPVKFYDDNSHFN